MRVSGVQGRHYLVVVAARLALTQELDALDLDLIGIGLRLQQLDDLVDELVERHREFAFPLSGNKIGGHRRRLQLLDLHRRVGQLQTQRLGEPCTSGRSRCLPRSS